MIYRQQEGLIWARLEQAQEGTDPLLSKYGIWLNCNTEKTESGYKLFMSKSITWFI